MHLALSLSSLVHRFLPDGHAARLSISPAPQPLQQLQKGATLVVPRPAGVRVTCVAGSVWITHDGDCKDVLLAAGESYASERAARMLVHGLAASSVLMH